MIEKERNYLFDNIKAFLITSTVFAHLLKQSPTFEMGTFEGYLYFMIFSYIMQGFILLSGYFSKNTLKCRNTAVKNFLVPYIFFQALVSLISIGITGEPREGFIEPSFALWFLFAMFVFRGTIDWTSKIPHVVPIAFVLYFVSGILSLDDRWTAARIGSFFLFYIIGYSLKEDTFEKIRNIEKRYIISLLVLLAAVSWIICYFELFPVDLLYCKKPYENYGLGILEGMICRLIICILFFGWMCVFVNLFPKRRTLYSDIGRKTITVYLLHIGVRYLFMYTDISGDGGVPSFLIAIAATIIAVWLFSRDTVFREYNRLIDMLYVPINFAWQKIKCLKNILKVVHE